MLAALSLFSFKCMAIGGLELTIKGGLSIPNDELGNVYNAENKSINGDIVTFQDVEAATGYTVGLKAAVPITDYLYGYAHAGIHQTGEQEYQLIAGTGSSTETYGTITASQFIIPVGVGAELRFFEVAMADLYTTAQLNFNYLTSDFEIVSSALNDGTISDATSDARLGYGIGIGSDFDFKVIETNVELLFQSLNPVLAEEEEDMKTLVSLTVGLVF
jgi:hypothetical protein